MSELQIGACIYCGQSRQIEADGRKTEQELANMATMLCNCEEAKAAQDVEMMQTTAETNVEKLFREENPDMASLLKAAVLPIMGDRIDQIIIKSGKMQGKVSVNSKGGIKVERTDTHKKALES